MKNRKYKKPILSRSFLIENYIDKNMTARDISKILDCHHMYIIDQLKMHSIALKTRGYCVSLKTKGKKKPDLSLIMKGRNRNFSEEHCKNLSLSKQKEKHHMWKGGITPLGGMIRNSDEYYRWRKLVFSRDSFKCQRCTQNYYLEAHHIKSFSKILSEFLQKYDMFSPIEDKETLVRLAMQHLDFWDINNGQTLCEACHNKVTIHPELPYQG